MTNPSPPSSPFEQVVEETEQALDRRMWGRTVPAILQAALDTGLLKLVEERPEGEQPDRNPPQRQDSLSDQLQGLEAFAVEHGMYDAHDWLRKHSGHQPEGEPSGLDGAEAHELYSMFLAHVCSSEFHPRHPLLTGAKKLAAMLDENHARFNEVLSDDDDLAEQPRGELSEYIWYDRDEDVTASLAPFPNHPHIVAILRLDAPDRGQVGIYIDRDQATEIAKWLAIDNPSGEGPRCTCERGADLDHWSRCDVHRVERSYTAPLTPSDTEGEDG